MTENNNMSITLEPFIQKILEAKHAYYTLGKPIMSDQEYDGFITMIESIEPDHPILNMIGSNPSPLWKSAKHHIPMGSLLKVNTEQEFRAWAERLLNQYPEGVIFVIQLKLDGLSISLDYVNGVFVRGVTRGNDNEGEDITPNIRRMKDHLESIPGFTGSVRAEILLSRSDFDRINSVLPNDDKYENPRNAAAGISRRLDGRFCQYLFMMAYNFVSPDFFSKTESIKVETLKKLGFRATHVVVGNVDAMVEAYNKIKEMRKELTVDIDGTVIKVDNIDIFETAGYVGGKPRAHIAWKFDPPGAATILNEVIWDVGRTGVVTPVGIVEPVKIEGSTITRVTLHNVAEIIRLNVKIFDVVMLIKANDIIPKITSVIETKETNPPIVIPTHCPRCGSLLENDGTRLFCRNDQCYGKNLFRIMNWVKVTDIEQLGESLVKVLYSEEKLNSIADIYGLTVESISKLEGWGQSSAETIIENINGTRTLKPETFLAGIGIPTISHRTAEELLKAFKTVDGVLLATHEQICALKGFSDVSATAVIEGLRKFEGEIRKLMEIIKLGEDKKEGKLSGKSFCFTGAMANPRTYYQKLVTDHGGRNMSTVTKDLMYLVCNEDKGSSKSVKARKFGTQIISEQEFLEMVGEENVLSKSEYKIEMPSLFDEE
jgi:DNA ligase (NAD+)